MALRAAPAPGAPCCGRGQTGAQETPSPRGSCWKTSPALQGARGAPAAATAQGRLQPKRRASGTGQAGGCCPLLAREA